MMKPLLCILIALFFQSCTGGCEFANGSDTARFFRLQITRNKQSVLFRKVITFEPFIKEVMLSKVPVSYKYTVIHLEVTDTLDNKDTVIISYELSAPWYSECYNEGRLSPQRFSIKHHTFDSTYKIVAYAY